MGEWVGACVSGPQTSYPDSVNLSCVLRFWLHAAETMGKFSRVRLALGNFQQEHFWVGVFVMFWLACRNLLACSASSLLLSLLLLLLLLHALPPPFCPAGSRPGRRSQPAVIRRQQGGAPRRGQDPAQPAAELLARHHLVQGPE